MGNIDLTQYIQVLEKNKRLIRVRKEVSTEFEMSAVLRKVNGDKSIFFEKIKNYNIPVVSGLCGNRDDWAKYFGVKRNKIREKLASSIDNPISWEVVNSGACQENEILEPGNLLDLYPIPKFSEKDSGHFITAGVVVVKEHDTGNLHTSIRRLQVNSNGTISILIESPGLMERYKAAENRGEDLEIAILIGVHPVIILASQVNSQLYTVDKMCVAGALCGEAIEMVKCRSIDLVVPAHTEIVIEGKILAKHRHIEGPFGELAGYYGLASEQPIIKINCITYRNDPIFQVISPGSTEHKLPNAMMREVVLYDMVKRTVAGVKDVHLTMAGSGRFHAIVSIDKQFEGEGKNAIFAALASNKDIKHVVVVNNDVDIFDLEDVEWAIATRVQAGNDVFVIKEARGCSLEPSNNLRGVSDKMGIDATYPINNKEMFSRITTPGLDKIKLEDYL